MRGETLHLIVHPENASRARHEVKLTGGEGAEQRAGGGCTRILHSAHPIRSAPSRDHP
jgi:hypothetical protein